MPETDDLSRSIVTFVGRQHACCRNRYEPVELGRSRWGSRSSIAGRIRAPIPRQTYGFLE